MSEMRTIIFIVDLCVTLFPLIIHGADPKFPLQKDVKSMAERGEPINDIFIPSQDGLLGDGCCGFTYKGLLLSINQEVAMKFIPHENRQLAENEYEMYWCLDAINNTKIEAYGVPSVYYYGQWNAHTLMAITLLDTKINAKPPQHPLNEADILIIFLEFVRISKYIHSKGICHADIHLGNIMFRKHQVFLIDYDDAIKRFKRDENDECAPTCANRDFLFFVFAMCNFVHFEANFLNYQLTIERISNIEHPGLNRVYSEFIKYAFGSEMPNYQELYKIISEEIENCKVKEPALVSWLSPKQRKEAKTELKKHRVPSIESIVDPSKLTDLKYPKPNFNFFDGDAEKVKKHQKKNTESSKWTLKLKGLKIY